MTSVKFPRRTFLQLAALHLAAGAGVLPALSRIARAQAYPARPIRFIVPSVAGGGLDFVARLIADHVSRAVAQPIIIENKAGGGGLLGIEAAAKSPPDGYTALICNDSLVSAPHIVKFNVDYVWSLLPVIQTVRTGQVVVVHPSLGVRSIGELIDAAKRRPGMAYASSVAQQHFLMEWIAQAAGIKLEHIPYRGAGQSVNDLIAGHVMIGAAGPTAIIPHHRTGTLRIIAQSSQTRARSLADVPTLEEAGLKGIVLELWQGAFVPARTPADIIIRLNTEIRRAVLDPMIGQKLLEASYEPVGGSAEQLAALVREDSDKYARLARELNIRAD